MGIFTKIKDFFSNTKNNDIVIASSIQGVVISTEETSKPEKKSTPKKTNTRKPRKKKTD